jgi:O-Antigen ligase
MRPRSAEAGPNRPGTSETIRLALLLGLVGLGTVAAAVFGGANPLLSVVPILLVAGFYAATKAPLRWSVLGLLLGLLTLEISTDTAGLWHTPLVIFGDLLNENLDRVVPGLKLNGLEVILLFLLGVGIHRRATGSTVDGPGPTPTAGVLRDFLVLYMVAFLFVEVNGLLRGASPAVWKIRLLLHVPVLFMVFNLGLRGTRDHGLVAGVVLLAASWRAALAIYVQRVVAPSLTGGELAFATSHGDSITFSVAMFILIMHLVERPDLIRLRRLVLLSPLLLWGMVANGRRLAWVMLGLSLLAALLLRPARPWMRRLLGVTMVVVPLVALYLAIGWNRGSPAFAPVRILRSLSDSSVDRSTLWRETENWNIAMSIKEHPVLGIGLGGEYTEHMPNDDLSALYPEYRAWPHNSVLGLLLFSGVIAFTALWALYAVTVFLAVRSHGLAQVPEHRVAALTCVAAVISCTVAAYGDTGPNLIPYRVFWGLAAALAGQLAVETGAWPRAVRWADRGRLGAAAQRGTTP